MRWTSRRNREAPGLNPKTDNPTPQTSLNWSHDFVNQILCADSLAAMAHIPDASIDTIITDPPYGLKFMGKKWDHQIPGVEAFAEMLRVAKPGAFLLCFGGTRTFHRIACNIEDAGWEMRDTMMWLYGQGFPKSLDVSKAIDKAAGAKPIATGQFKRASIQRNGDGDTWKAGAFASHPEETKQVAITAPATPAAQEWDGWGTALKPAWEPIIVAMKPCDGTFAENAQRHGVAGLWIDGGRVSTSQQDAKEMVRCNTPNSARHKRGYGTYASPWSKSIGTGDLDVTKGRWPANVILSHHPDCKRVGTKRVRGHKGHPTSVAIGLRDDTKVFGKGNGEYVAKGHTDPDGKETVQAWDCHPDCPIRILDEQSGICGDHGTNMRGKKPTKASGNGIFAGGRKTDENVYGMVGGASRFFYTAKASRSERECNLKGRLPCLKCGGLDTDTHTDAKGRTIKCYRNDHPTVKPLKIMRYLARLTKTPTGGIVFDPYCGSGTTAVACRMEDCDFIAIDNDPHACDIARARLTPSAPLLSYAKGKTP